MSSTINAHLGHIGDIHKSEMHEERGCTGKLKKQDSSEARRSKVHCVIETARSVL
jgi:hypothetical protein